MARRALVLALAAALAGAVAGCRAGKSDAHRESTEKATVPIASASMQTGTPTPTAPAPDAPMLEKAEGEGDPIDKRLGEIPTGMASASSASTLQANHNPKGSEPERAACKLCPPGVPLCGLEHNPKGTEPERRPELPPPEVDKR